MIVVQPLSKIQPTRKRVDLICLKETSLVKSRSRTEETGQRQLHLAAPSKQDDATRKKSKGTRKAAGVLAPRAVRTASDLTLGRDQTSHLCSTTMFRKTTSTNRLERSCQVSIHKRVGLALSMDFSRGCREEPQCVRRADRRVASRVRVGDPQARERCEIERSEVMMSWPRLFDVRDRPC